MVIDKKFKELFEKDFFKIKKRYPIYLGQFDPIEEYLIEVSD